MNRARQGFNRRALGLVGIMVLVTLITNFIAIYIHFNAVLEGQQTRLREWAQMQAYLLEARIGLQQANRKLSPFLFSFAQAQESLASVSGHGKSPTLILAQKEGDSIRYLVISPSPAKAETRSLPWQSEFALPLRLALQAKSGVVRSINVKRQSVLAAYEPIQALEVGLVAQIELREIYRPLIGYALKLIAVSLFFILLGARFCFVWFNPVLHALAQEVKDSKDKEETSIFQEKKLSRVLTLANMGSWEWRREDSFFSFSKELQELLGLTVQERQSPYEAFLACIHPEDRDQFQFALDQAMSNGMNFSLDHRVVTAFGKALYVHSTGEVVWDAEGVPSKMLGIMQDITESKSATQRIQLLATVFENAQEGVVITDHQNHIIEVNPSFEKITGFTFAEVKGHNPKRLSSGRHKKPFYQAMWASIQETSTWSGEVWDRKKSGDIYPKHLNITAFKNEISGKTNYLGVFSDISQQKENEAKLAQMAYYDPLTNLPNRSFFIADMIRELQLAERAQISLAVLFLDLDRFKHVNDSFGHQVGDQLLIQVAARLKEALRESDLIARLGGDEFVVCLRNIEDPADAGQVAQNILQALHRSFNLEGHLVYINTSIGISLYPQDGSEPGVLIKNADSAMYLSKEKGKGIFSFFTQALNEKAQKRIFLDSSLHQALEQDQFFLQYQPQVEIATGQIVGLEALIRWRHPTRGLISPVDFIALAEETGLIVPIGDWVLQEACAKTKQWQDAGLKPGVISVNVSQKQFARGDILQSVTRTLKQTGLDPKQLKLELTESLFIKGTNHAIEILHHIRDLGVGLSIDDFGTGFSSLSYLKNIPLTDLKVDQSFVKGLLQDSRIAEAIISLAKSLHLSIIAEGAEEKAQVDFLNQLGCQRIQGYYYSKPLEEKDLLPLLRQGKIMV